MSASIIDALDALPIFHCVPSLANLQVGDGIPGHGGDRLIGSLGQMVIFASGLVG